jgi:uncharacterized membrane protein YgaE (UPF0421/DUF939 family)
MIKISDIQPWALDLKRATIDRLQMQQILRVLIAAILSFGLSAYFHIPEGYWISVSALLGLYFSMPLVLRRRYGLVVGIALAIGLLALITSLIAASTIQLAFFLFVLSLITVYIGLTYHGLWPAAFVASFYAILSAGLLTNLDGSMQRFCCIVLGFAIAIAVQIVFGRIRVAADLRYALAESLLRLAELSQAIFSCYVAHNYQEEHFNYEKNLHACRGSFLYKISQARTLLTHITSSQQQEFSTVVGCIEQCYEIFQSLGLLIQRVDDHSTFAVADKEFLALSGNVDTYLRQMATEINTQKIRHEEYAILSENIYELEEINRTVLQVVAKDPLVFMIFIQDMYALEKMFLRLFAAIAVYIRVVD